MQSNSLRTKRILAIGPIRPKWSDLAGMDQVLAFLYQDFSVEMLDPLAEISSETGQEDFYKHWSAKLEDEYYNYDIFMGFSFGGVILQQCFHICQRIQKKIILFSTPSFIDYSLEQNLKAVIKKVQNRDLVDALVFLNKKVFSPNESLNEPPEIIGSEQAASLRLYKGLDFILNTDSRQILAHSRVKYLNFVGELSCLVNKDSVVQGVDGKISVVPLAGMRVLQDNQKFCQNKILEFLNDK